MRCLIISCSPQVKTKSSSCAIAEWARDELSAKYDTSDIETCFLCNRYEWEKCAEAFYRYDKILIVTPLYVESVPGVFLEFLDTLEPEKKINGVISFILLGGFEEASQLRTAEKFLDKLPEYFNCQYGGTLIKGGMFGMASIRGEGFRRKMEVLFKAAIDEYGEKGCFKKEYVSWFAGPEYYSKAMIFLAKLTKPLNRVVWYIMGKKMGVQASLRTRPYEVFNR